MKVEMLNLLFEGQLKLSVNAVINVIDRKKRINAEQTSQICAKWRPAVMSLMATVQ